MKDENIQTMNTCLSLVLCMMFVVDAQAEVNGENLYVQNCMVCHGDDGSGAMPGVKDLVENRAWLIQPESQLFDRLKRGIQGPGALVAMPPKGGNPALTDEQLMVVIMYMRNSFQK